MADLSHIFESLKELSAEDGTVGVERLKHVLVKIGMQDADAKSVMNVLQTSEGRVNLNDFAAWVSLKPQMSVAWNDNIILATDSYKFSHWKQYPPGTEYVYSYFESRGCERKEWNEVAFFGLQYFLKRYLLGQVITQAKIDEAVTMCSEHFIGDGLFYKEGFQYILEKHGGKLPISIKAIPEGMVVPTKTALFTMVNTDPKCYWLTNFLETLLVQVWYPMTVCTNSRYQKLSIHKALAETGNEDWGIPGGSCFKLHDFGFRGVSSVESAALGGAAHLVNFLGTDTVAALLCCRRYYHATKAAGHSIPASEHSTITSWGVEHEVDAMKNMLLQYPSGLVACVSDSFDVFKACREYWGDELKELIKGRISGDSWGRLVVRPDSGDPTETCVQIVTILCQQFQEDVITTKTGHRLLPPYIRVIQGDGVDYESVPKILGALKDAGFAADNMVFGSGGALLQKLNRDTFKCAFKCSEITVNGQAREVFKDPITDKGKASKKGRLTVQRAEETQGREEAPAPSATSPAMTRSAETVSVVSEAGRTRCIHKLAWRTQKSPLSWQQLSKALAGKLGWNHVTHILPSLGRRKSCSCRGSTSTCIWPEICFSLFCMAWNVSMQLGVHDEHFNASVAKNLPRFARPAKNSNISNSNSCSQRLGIPEDDQRPCSSWCSVANPVGRDGDVEAIGDGATSWAMMSMACLGLWELPTSLAQDRAFFIGLLLSPWLWPKGHGIRQRSFADQNVPSVAT